MTSPATISVAVKTLDHQRLEVEVRPDITVPELKQLLACKAGCPVDEARVLHRGKVLKPDKRLSDYVTKSGQTLHLVQNSKRNLAGASLTDPPAEASKSNASTDAVLTDVLSSLAASPSSGDAQSSRSEEVLRDIKSELVSTRLLLDSLDAEGATCTQPTPTANVSGVAAAGSLIEEVATLLQRCAPLLQNLGRELSSLKRNDDQASAGVLQRMDTVRKLSERLSSLLGHTSHIVDTMSLKEPQPPPSAVRPNPWADTDPSSSQAVETSRPVPASAPSSAPPDLSGMMQAMGPMLSGLAGGGRGGGRGQGPPDLSGMMQAMGPMLSGLAGGGRGGGRGASSAVPASVSPAMELSSEELRIFENTAARDEIRQADIKQRGLSDAYLSGRKGHEQQQAAAAASVQEPQLLLERMLLGAADQSGVQAPDLQDTGPPLSREYLGVIARSMAQQARADPDFDAAQHPNLDQLLRKLGD